MKKFSKILIFALTILFILPFAVMVTGCANQKITVNFYDENLHLISSSDYTFQSDNGVSSKKIVTPNAPTITGYNNVGWHITGYGKIEDVIIANSIWNFDDETWFAGEIINFVAAYEISDSGWHYVGEETDGTNAFRWTGSNYTSPALQLVAGENYIRFDKTTTEYALKYCKVFENGSDSVGHIQNVQILDSKAIYVDDIDLTLNVWENQTLQANATGSFIIKITTTKAFEAGIMIGENIS